MNMHFEGGRQSIDGDDGAEAAGTGGQELQ